MIADPILPDRVFLSSALLERDAHGRSINGRNYVMVFRLVRNGAAAAPALPRAPGDDRSRPWEDAYRMPRPLPEGKWVIESAIAQSTFEQDLGPGLGIEDRSVTRSVSSTRGMGRRNQVSFDLVNSEGSARLRIPGSSFSLGEISGSALGVAWTTFHDWPLPLDATAVTHVGAIWSEFGAPDFMNAQVQVEARVGSWSLSFDNELATDLDHGDTLLLTTPAISYSTSVSSGVTLGGAVALEIEDFRTSDRLYGRLFLTRMITPTLSLAVYREQELLERDDVAESRFGLSLIVSIPRPMRQRRKIVGADH